MRALAGIDTLVFVSSDGEAARVVVHHRNVLQAAAECGVGHVVFLSGLDVAADSPFCYAFTNRDAEQLLRASGTAVLDPARRPVRGVLPRPGPEMWLRRPER